MLKVLVIGGGAREHAILWKLAQSAQVSRLFWAPANAGIDSVRAIRAAEEVPVDVSDIEGLVRFAVDTGIDLTVIGPEGPLIAGVVDAFELQGLRVFGPAREPAMIEGSKSYAKRLMRRYNIPTADFDVFTEVEPAMAYAREYFKRHPGKKLVVKADGLAAGKGVIICEGLWEAEKAIQRMLTEREFGTSGEEILLEDGLEGREVSLMAITDGKTILPLLPAQDNKRVYDNDEGPNTGGMGCFAPVPFFTEEMLQYAMEHIMNPLVSAVRDTGIPYKGIVYAGLMVEPDGAIKVIEFNARFGDPETEVVLPLLENDLAAVFLAATNAELHEVELTWRNEVAVTVVMASGGYPGAYKTGIEIEGLDQVGHLSDVCIFHAGTSKTEDGKVLTAGGRVLSVTGLGEDFEQARARAYAAVRAVEFEGAHYRTDIGTKAIAMLEEMAASAMPESEEHGQPGFARFDS